MKRSNWRGKVVRVNVAGQRFLSVGRDFEGFTRRSLLVASRKIQRRRGWCNIAAYRDLGDSDELVLVSVFVC